MTQKHLRKLGRAAFLLAALSGGLFAGIIDSSGQITVISAPEDASLGALTSNSSAFIFLESMTLLNSKLKVNAIGAGTYDSNGALTGGNISAGTGVASYLLHADSARGNHEYIGSITFNTPILGVISQNKTSKLWLDETDTLLGAPGTTYDTGDTVRDLELGSPSDSFTISSDLKTLSFDFQVGGNMDEIRVLTMVPEPGTIGLLLSGAAGMLALRRRMVIRRTR